MGRTRGEEENEKQVRQVLIDKKTYEKSYFDVLGICCPSDVPSIEGILNALEGVEGVSVVVPSKTVVVVHDPLLISASQIGLYISPLPLVLCR